MVNHFKICQFGKLLGLFLALVAIGAYIQIEKPAGQQSVFLLTSLIAITPVIVSGFWNMLKKPCLRLSDVEIIDFPQYAYDAAANEGDGFNNAICVRAHVKNIGFETAIDCRCELKEESIGRKFPTRWSFGGSNPIHLDLSPGEEQFVDLMWLDHSSNSIRVPMAISGNDQHGGMYQKSEPAELQALENGDFHILMSASNMAERREFVEELSAMDTDLQETLKDSKTLNPYSRSLQDRGYDYAIGYKKGSGWEIYIPMGMNTDKLERMHPLSKMLYETGHNRISELGIEIHEVEN